MVKAVFQLGSALLAETSLTDLVCGTFLDRFADSIGNVRIAAVHGKVRGKCIINIDDDLHLWHCADHLFQNIHGNIDFPVTIQLITEQVCKKHVVRLQAWEYMPCGSLVNLDAGVICIQPACRSGSKHKSRYNAVQHIGAGMIAHYLLAFPFQRRTKHIVGCCFSIGSAGYEDFAPDLGGKVFQNMGIDLQCDLACPGNTLASHFPADKACRFRRTYGCHCSYIHVYSNPFSSVVFVVIVMLFQIF